AGAGATLASGFYQSSAQSIVAGEVTVSRDLTISAEAIETKNVTRSFADVAAEIGPSRAVQAVNDFLAGIDLSFEVAGHTFDPLGGRKLSISDLGITIGAAMTFVES